MSASPSASQSSNPLIIALDLDGANSALELADRLDPGLCRVKVGKGLFTRAGPPLVRALQGRGFEVFLDLKFHDIPNTVADAVRAAADLGVWMVNLHAGGGSRMMEAARAALGEAAQRPLLTAVTVLTSLSPQDLAQLGYGEGPRERAARLARLAQDSGLDGVVCSARESSALRAQCGADFKLVTPGIRPAGDGADDQRRVAAPAEAIAAGSDYLVIGRPVTRSADPAAALRRIRGELGL